jgi:hypothetical protein
LKIAEWKTISPQLEEMLKQRPFCFKMDEDLKFLINGRQPQYACHYKTTQIIPKLKTSSIFMSIEDDIKKKPPKRIKIKTMGVAPSGSPSSN